MTYQNECIKGISELCDSPEKKTEFENFIEIALNANVSNDSQLLIKEPSALTSEPSMTDLVEVIHKTNSWLNKCIRKNYAITCLYKVRLGKLLLKLEEHKRNTYLGYTIVELKISTNRLRECIRLAKVPNAEIYAFFGVKVFNKALSASENYDNNILAFLKKHDIRVQSSTKMIHNIDVAIAMDFADNIGLSNVVTRDDITSLLYLIAINKLPMYLQTVKKVMNNGQNAKEYIRQTLCNKGVPPSNRTNLKTNPTKKVKSFNRNGSEITYLIEEHYDNVDFLELLDEAITEKLKRGVDLIWMKMQTHKMLLNLSPKRPLLLPKCWVLKSSLETTPFILHSSLSSKLLNTAEFADDPLTSLQSCSRTLLLTNGRVKFADSSSLKSAKTDDGDQTRIYAPVEGHDVRRAEKTAVHVASIRLSWERCIPNPLRLERPIRRFNSKV